MTIKDFENSMIALIVKHVDKKAGKFDAEACHREMDLLMCTTLNALGYTKGVRIFLESMRWYS